MAAGAATLVARSGILLMTPNGAYGAGTATLQNSSLVSTIPPAYVCAAYAAAARWPHHHPYQYLANWMQVTDMQALQACSLAAGAGLITRVSNGVLTSAGVALCADLEFPLWIQPYNSSPGSQPAGGPWRA